MLPHQLTRRATLAGIASFGLAKQSFAKPKQLCGTVVDAPAGLICSPTINAVPFVQFNGNVYGMALPNVSPFGPNPFSFLVHSSWHCCPPGPGSVTGCNMTFTPINMFYVNVGANYGSQANCEVQVYTSGAVRIYDAHFNPLPQSQWHVLVSVNTNTQTVQLFVNDVPYSPTSGGWTGSGQMPGAAGVGSSTALDVGSAGGVYAAAADIWEMATPGWVDLTVVANRRKFINADLSPVDLGANGQSPFGTPPNFYLAAYSGVPTDFAVNRGTSGGTFTINLDGPLTMQAPGTCACACGSKQVVLTSGTTWTVPADWNNGNNKIEAIGGGQGGGFGWGTGGGGAAYTVLANVALTPGAVIPIVIGQGGAGKTASGTASDYGLAGTATSFNGGQVLADPAGVGGGTAGGQGVRCVPHGVDGAEGGSISTFAGAGGGGGAGGPNGVGAVGGSPNFVSPHCGGGGGGANGGGVGQNADPGGNGGQGGTAFDGTAGGAGGIITAVNGGAGSHGSGGGGAYSTVGTGGAGSSSPVWGSFGIGSGGGGAGYGSGPGGAGGLFGGGAGGGVPGGQGGNGAIIITYVGAC
jgi:hypothetical protein